MRGFEHVFGASRFYGHQFFFVFGVGEFRDSFNFRSQFLKFGVMDTYSNGFQSILFNLMANATYIRLLRVCQTKNVVFLAETF